MGEQRPVTGPGGHNPITDEQIEALRGLAGLAGQHWIVTDTFAAVTVGKSDMFWREVTAAERDDARTRCAAAYNARRGAQGS